MRYHNIKRSSNTNNNSGNTKLRICILCNGGYPTDTLEPIGGVEFATKYLAEELIKKGHEVHIVARSIEKKTITTDKGLVVHYIAYASSAYLKSEHFRYRYVIQQLTHPISSLLVMRIICKIHPDIVQCQHKGHVIAAYLAKIIAKIPYILSLHGEIKGDVLFPLPNALKHFWKKLPFISNSSEILCLTNDAKDIAEQLLGNKLTVIPNGVNQEIFHQSGISTRNIQKIELICVSRLVNNKGLEDIISAMQYIIQEFPNTILRIVGDGILMNKLVKMTESLQLNKNILFSGKCKQEEVASYYNQAAIFLLPSLSEGFPLTVLEACSCGLPVILTPFHGAEEFISQNNCGLIVPFSSPKILAESVIKLLSNPSMYETLSHNSINIAKKRSWEQIATHYIECYSRCIRLKRYT